MKTPDVYADWLDVFDLIKNGGSDAEALEAMENGKFEWQSVTSEMFVKKYCDAAEKRLDKAMKAFDNNMAHAAGRESIIVSSISSLSRELSFLYKTASAAVWLSEQKKQLQDMILSKANQIQSSLEASAAADRTGRMKVLIKNHKITVS